MRPFLLLLVLALLPTTGCRRWPGPTAAPRVTTLFGGNTGYELVSIPALANVQAYRVAPRQTTAATAPATRPTVAGLATTAGPFPVPADSLKRLAELLPADATYQWDMPKGCKFQPEAVLRYAGVKRTIDVVFCFTCNQLRVYEGNRQIGAADFDPRAPEIAAAVRAALAATPDAR